MSVWAPTRSVNPANSRSPRNQRERRSVWKTFLVVVNSDKGVASTNLIFQLGFVFLGVRRQPTMLIISISHAIWRILSRGQWVGFTLSLAPFRRFANCFTGGGLFCFPSGGPACNTFAQEEN